MCMCMCIIIISISIIIIIIISIIIIIIMNNGPSMLFGHMMVQGLSYDDMIIII